MVDGSNLYPLWNDFHRNDTWIKPAHNRRIWPYELVSRWKGVAVQNTGQALKLVSRGFVVAYLRCNRYCFSGWRNRLFQSYFISKVGVFSRSTGGVAIQFYGTDKPCGIVPLFSFQKTDMAGMLSLFRSGERLSHVTPARGPCAISRVEKGIFTHSLWLFQN